MTKEQQQIIECAKELTNGIKYRVAHYTRNADLIGGSDTAKENITFIEAMEIFNGHDELRPFSYDVEVEEFKDSEWQKSDLKALELKCKKIVVGKSV